MNTIFPWFGRILLPKGWGPSDARLPDLLLCVGAALAIAIAILFIAVAPRSGAQLPTVFNIAEIEPAVIDPFNQQDPDQAPSSATAKQLHLNNAWPRMTRSATPP